MAAKMASNQYPGLSYDTYPGIERATSTYSTASSSYYPSGYDCDNNSQCDSSISSMGSGFTQGSAYSANNRALQLLQTDSGVINSGKESGIRRSQKFSTRETWARSKANKLMEDQMTGRSNSRTSIAEAKAAAYQLSSKGSFDSSRSVSTNNTRKSSSQKNTLKTISDEPIGLAAYKRRNPHAGKKATTTRKIEKTAEDVRDPETIPGMKCQLYIDREVKATKKANQLLIDITNAGVECMI